MCFGLPLDLLMHFAENVELLPYNCFRLRCLARYFLKIGGVDELSAGLDQAETLGIKSQFILGGGSNILFTKNFDGLVLKNEIKGIKILNEDEEHIYVKAGAGESWHEFVMFCVHNDYAGIENLSLIPGNVGASPMQNIGAYGVEIKEVFHELEAFHKKEKTIRKFSLADCEFGYRDSVFKHKYAGEFVITSVTYRLNKRPVFNISYGAVKQELEKMGVQDLSIQAVSKAVINIRSSKLPDPKEIGNAGSFFKNPVIPNEQFKELKTRFPDIVSFPAGDTHTKLAAGWLIEQCGWKGYRKGDAGCYPRQALVLVNYGHATGQEILQLSEQIIDSVKNKFRVDLEREVNLV
jgi:UDP-N-acetylmuramate dehydrogenase